MKAPRIIGITLVSGLLIGLLFSLHSPQTSRALDGSQFEAGRIIDDAVFFNDSAMSVGQIQSFLDSKLPTCDTNGSITLYDSAYGDTVTRAVYSSRRGVSTPFVCLKDYTQTISGVTNSGSDLCTGSVSAGTKSSAQLIYDVAQACGINPQTLLVLLQKEQSLVTDDWPWPRQYEIATGYGCPDTAPCNDEYYGFFNQIYQAAQAFRRYEANPTLYNYQADRNNFIYYHPSLGACGGSTVFIENQATANLYIYTPYQPNAAALNNLYGSGDGCSAYGNRNFWRMFNDWFGSTAGVKPFVNLDWNFEYLDGSTTGVNPNTNTVGAEAEAIVFNGVLYTFYYDSTDRNLLLSYADHLGWHNQVLDGEGGSNGEITASLGRLTSAMIYNNELHIFYYDQTNKSLRHGWLDSTGTTWTFETLDGTASSVAGLEAALGAGSSAVESNGSLQLFYYNQEGGNLRHAWYKPADGWKFEDLDGSPTSVSRYDSNVGISPQVLLHTNGLQLFYYDNNYGNVRHAWTTSTGWKFEDLDGSSGSVSRYSANVGRYITATKLGGGLQLYYYDSSGGNLRHAWTTSTGWKFEQLDGSSDSVSRQAANVGIFPATTVINNVLYVFYRDAGAGDFRYAWADGSGWNFASLEGSIDTTSGILNDTGITPAVTELSGSVQLFYFDNTARALRHTWATY